MHFLNDKFIRDLADQIRIELVKDGWTPPPDKPDPPRDPVRALVDQSDSGGIAFSEQLPSESCKRRNIPLIEAGWCQMVEHDGSVQCPVADVPVSVLFRAGNYESFQCATSFKWEKVKRYAVIMPVEG